MTPVVFGPPERRLMGFFHEPQKFTQTRAGIVMCYPLGHEATRIHRLYRVLAERLARQGAAVLRFDYFGTGDSPGDDLDGEMDGWCDDILRAHGELGRLADVDTVHWIGSRLGATLALQAAHHVATLTGLVLWDPIVEGAAYITELRVAHALAVDLSFYARDKAWFVAQPERDTRPLTEAIGFSISGQLAAQMAALRSTRLKVPPEVAAVVFARPTDRRVGKWCHADPQAAHGIRLETLDHPIVWTSDPLANSAIVPSEVTQRLSALFHDAH